MCWINLVASRSDTREEAELLLDDWEDTKGVSSWPMRPILLAFLSGEPASIKRARKLSHRLLKTFADADADDLLELEVLPDVATLSVAAFLDGSDQTKLWQTIAAGKPKHPLMRSLQSVIARLLAPPQMAIAEPVPVYGHIHSEQEWMRLVKTAPVHRLFDLAISPDHPVWLSCLQSFVVPLCALYERELKAAGNANTLPEDLLRLGAYPWRHPEVLYERHHPRPDSLSIPDPKEPDTWFGFDAITMEQGVPRGYHYLGFDWQAPLIFEKGGNAFRFLDTVNLSWDLALRDSTKTASAQLRSMQLRDDFVHVVVCDQKSARSLQPDLDEAASHYGLRIHVEDVTSA